MYFYRVDVFVTVVLILFLCCINGAKKQNDLQIVTEFKPDDCSEFADVGDSLEMHYTGYLDTGTVFDTSKQPNRGPLPVVLGQGKVIPGWEQGIKGMCVGEKRKLIIPPRLAYGAQGHPPVIPGDATLTFETELVSLTKKPAVDQEVIFRTLRFLAIPIVVACAIYYFYGAYKKTPTKKEAKEGRRAKKKN